MKRWKWLACAAAGLALLFACPLTANAADAVKYIDENGTEQTLTEYQDITQLEKPERWSSNDGPAWFVVPPGQDVTIEIKDGSHNFTAVVTGEFVPEHTWVFDNGSGDPFEWVEEDGTSTHI